ncbi:MAG: alpha/beta hydrolase [Chitinophagales bacterium]|nr:alpha/beta hydrolase [Chitinophagales bacterium]
MRTLFLFLLLLSTTFGLQAQSPFDTLTSQYAAIGDVKIHYKVSGKGDPLIFLHGSMECMEDWSKQIPDFARRYKVIAMDNRGHGRSTFTDRKIDYKLLSEDVVGLMDELKIDSAYIVGFGDGGIIGLYLSINHPVRVRKMVAIGANYKVDTNVVYREVLDKVKAWDEDKVYAFVRNNFKGWPNEKLLKPFTERMKTMLLTEPNLTVENLKTIKTPTLFVAGDHDIIKLSHTSEMFESVQQGYLAIIPGAKHYPHKEKSMLLNNIISDFLSKRFVKLSRF